MNLRRINTVVRVLTVAFLATVGSTVTATAATAPTPSGCGEMMFAETTEVALIIEDEVTKLSEKFPTICDMNWTLTPMTDYLGLAYDDDAQKIEMNPEASLYTQGGAELDAMVRHVVRHEFSHQVTYLTYTLHNEGNGPILDAFFGASPGTGYEVAADAMAVAIDPSDIAPMQSWRVERGAELLKVLTP